MAISRQSVQEQEEKEKYAVVLDVDNTLTPPRRPLESDMARALCHMRVPFFLGAGGDLRLVLEQFIEPLHSFGYRGSFDAFLCNGSTRYRCELLEKPSITLIRQFDMRSHLGEERFQKLLRILETALDLDEFRLPAPMQIIGERIIDRGSMINVAPIGRPRERLSEKAHANRQAFSQYDHATDFRKKFLSHLRQELHQFERDGLFITLGGETSFDIVINGNDKSFPLRALLNEGLGRISYVADALFKGGNDEAVLTFIEEWSGPLPCPVEAIRVENWRETIGVLDRLGVINSTLA